MMQADVMCDVWQKRDVTLPESVIRAVEFWLYLTEAEVKPENITCKLTVQNMGKTGPYIQKGGLIVTKTMVQWQGRYRIIVSDVSHEAQHE